MYIELKLNFYPIQLNEIEFLIYSIDVVFDVGLCEVALERVVSVESIVVVVEIRC